MFFPAVELLTAVAMALLLWYGGLRVLDGTLTVGILAAFIQYTRRFFQPLQDLSEKFNLLQSAMASSERVFSLLDEPVTVREPEQPVALPRPVRGAVSFEGVWFRYSPTGPWVLKDVSFTASPGQTIALVGHTGAGKTTIVNLLLRFYDPDRGRITVDGVDIRKLSTSDLRSIIGFVQQDLFLFTGDVQHNLTLDARSRPRRPGTRPGGWARTGSSSGCRPATTTCWASAAGASASASGSCQLRPGAGARPQDPGARRSDRSVDAEAEALIQRAIAELMAGRTSLVVAHRLSTILHADEILVLHHGEIRERGSHRELLAQRGLYDGCTSSSCEGRSSARLPNPNLLARLRAAGYVCRRSFSTQEFDR